MCKNQQSKYSFLHNLSVVFLFFSLYSEAQTTKSILFIGNSYTYCWEMPMITDLMARSTGNTLNYNVSAIGGYTLEQHSGNGTTLGLIHQGNWDFVALQEYSQYPSEPFSTFQNQTLPYVAYLNNEINAYNPNAETIFYMTWGRKNGDASRCSRLPSVCTYMGMDALTRERYEYMAENYHGILSPAGAVWRYIRQNHPTIELFDTDDSHPIAAGAYATACSFYTAIFRKDPTQITYNYILSNEEAAQIRAAAKAVVYDSLMYWHIGEYDVVDTQAPSAPTGLNTTNLTETGFTLRWTASTDNVAVDEYRVFLNGVQVAATSNTSAAVSDLLVAHTYAMTVKAIDRSGNLSASSSVLNVSTPDTHAPGVPSVLTAEDITETGFTLNWSPSADNVAVTGYDIYRNGTYLKSVSGTSTSISGLSPSASYSFAITARDAAGNVSAQSTVLIVNTPDSNPPGTPTGLSASNITTSSFTLSWTASSDNVGVTGYDVYRNGTLLETVTGTTFGITGLTPSTTYSMTVRAKDAAGNVSSASTPYPVTTGAIVTDTEAPSVPDGLSASGVTQTSFTLSWNVSTDNVGVTDYDVYRNGILVQNTTGTSLSLTGLEASTTYVMTVRTNDLAGNHSAVSTGLNVVTLDPIAPDTEAPSIPSGLIATLVTETGFVLNWTASTDNVAVSGYNVYVNGLLLTTVPTTTATIADLTAGTSYSMTVSAKDIAGNTSAASLPVVVTTSGAAPDNESPTIPSSLQATGLTQAGFTLSWNASTDNVAVTVYDVYRNGNLYTSVSSNSAAISGLSANLTYAMTVRSRDAAGNSSGLSAILNVTTPDTESPNTPSGLSYTNLGQASFTLRWNASSDNVGVVGYDIYLNGDLEVTVTGTSAGISDLSAKTTYALTIKARDAVGNTSPTSSILYVTTLDTEAPTIPQDLSSSNLTQSGFTLSWEGSDDNIGVTGYIVYINGVQNSTPSGTSTAVSGLSASTTYQVTVAARDASGNVSQASEAIEITTPDTQAPTTPSGLTASNITQNSFTLNWLPSTDNVAVELYLVYRNGTLVATVSGTAAGITDLTVNATYTVTVRARDAAGNTSSAGSLNVTTPDTESPTAPTAPLVTNLSQNGFTLSWTAATDNVGVTGYNIYRNGILSLYSTTTTINVTGLLAATTYAYTVKARDLPGNLSKPSSAVGVTTPDTDSPTVPAGLSFSNLKQDSFTLNWTASTDNVGVTAYLVYQDGVLDTTVITASARISKLKAARSYSMTVKARDLANNLSAASTALKVTTADTEKPSVPSNLSVLNVGETNATLKWNGSKDNVRVTGYKMFLNGVLRSTVSDTIFHFTDLKPYSMYSFAVEALDSAGNSSGKCTPVQTRTLDVHAPDSPFYITADQIGDHEFVLHWSPASDNVGIRNYQVYVDNIRMSEPPDTSLEFHNMLPFTEYVIQIVAVDSAGNVSPKSVEFKVKTTDTLCPEPPDGIAVPYVSGDWLKVVWNEAVDNVGISGYEVFLDGSKVLETADIESEIRGLQKSQTYRVKVRAKDVAGNYSPFSDSLDVTTLATGFEPDLKGNVTVYPNPVTGNLIHIDFGAKPASGVIIELVDQGGSVVYRTVIEHPEKTEVISLLVRARGNFVIRIHEADKVTIQKLIFSEE